MSDRIPPFHEIVDGDDPDRERLLATHQLLAAAGPPPELPPSLEHAPAEPREQVIPFPRRRRYTAIGAVAAAALLLFAFGYTLGGHRQGDEAVRTVAMSGPTGATASLGLQPVDTAGNWPMIMDVQGLPQLPKGKTYTLWLTHEGKLAEPCGTFAVAQGTTSVWLNAPYKLKEYDGWVVVRTGTTKPFLLRTVTV